MQPNDTQTESKFDAVDYMFPEQRKKKSRWIFISLLVLLLTTIIAYGYWSPAIAFKSMRSAALAKDADTVNSYIDYPKLRENFKGQVHALLAKNLPQGDNAENAGATIGHSLGILLADRMIEALISPETFSSFITNEKMNAEKDRLKFDWHYKGLNQVIVVIETGQTGGQRPKLLFEREGFFNWKLTQIILPEDIEESKHQALKSTFQAAQKQMREAVTVTLLSKKIDIEYGYGGHVLDERIAVLFAYKNNTDKEIIGTKGLISIEDLFGKEITAIHISNEDTIPAGHTKIWSGSRSIKYSFGNEDNDRRFVELGEDKYTVVWKPEMIVFKDGTKLTSQ